MAPAPSEWSSRARATTAAVNRRGRSIVVRVVCTPLINAGDGRIAIGAILVIEPDGEAKS
jgi:hypothetical protein